MLPCLMLPSLMLPSLLLSFCQIWIDSFLLYTRHCKETAASAYMTYCALYDAPQLIRNDHTRASLRVLTALFLSASGELQSGAAEWTHELQVWPIWCGRSHSQILSCSLRRPMWIKKGWPQRTQSLTPQNGSRLKLKGPM